MQIVDAHLHFWDPTRNHHPWLCDEPPIAFRYGDYGALRRPYLPAEYRRDAAGFDVVAGVYIETEWNPHDPRGEVEWVSRLAATEGLPNAVVAQAWLDDPAAPALLAEYGGHPLVRGVRHKPPPGAMMNAVWRRGFAALAANGLSFDLQVPWRELGEAAVLADAFPETPIVIDHAGLPADRDAEALTGWREAIRGIAVQPNVAVKISGLGERGHPWTPDANRRIVLDAIDAFGPDRVMFASNYPVDTLVGSFATIMGGFLAIAAGFSEAERQAMFAGNARRFYRLP